jgi:hypothetical protein
MNALQKGLLLGALQVAIVASLGAKLTWDRHRLPRAWAKAGTYDPNLPIRGRYMALQLEAICDSVAEPRDAPPGVRPSEALISGYTPGKLRVQDGRLVTDCESTTGGFSLFRRQRPGQPATATISEPVLFFLPEHAKDPWLDSRGGELWAEVTLPVSGPPRPIRLAIKRGEAFTPLEVK